MYISICVFTQFLNTSKVFKYTGDSLTHRFQLSSRVFGKMVKRGLSCLIFTTKMPDKMLRFCLVHAYCSRSFTFVLYPKHSPNCHLISFLPSDHDLCGSEFI